jgi:hypothetical protein
VWGSWAVRFLDRLDVMHASQDEPSHGQPGVGRRRRARPRRSPRAGEQVHSVLLVSVSVITDIRDTDCVTLFFVAYAVYAGVSVTEFDGAARSRIESVSVRGFAPDQ